MRGASNNILKFRRAPPPPAGRSVECEKGRGCAQFRTSPPISASDFPCDAEPLAFHASESFAETLSRQGSDAIFWNGWGNGFAVGVLIVSIIALIGWPG